MEMMARRDKSETGAFAITFPSFTAFGCTSGLWTYYLVRFKKMFLLTSVPADKTDKVFLTNTVNH